MDSRNFITFLDCQLDLSRGEFHRGGKLVPTEPQVLDLIAHFAAHSGQVLSRDDLIDAVWGGRTVSDSAIATRINAARTALGDDGTTQRIIKTIPRRGFRFEVEVNATAISDTPALPDKPSIAVLPFQNMSGDPEQRYFSDGITDDIITELSRYEELFVIARHSTFTYRDATIPPSTIARELGVQYIAEGSVRRAGNRIRVTARLIDPWAGNELWSERYDRELTDIFEVQDEITAVIVNTLSGQIARQHYQRALAKSAETVAAYDHLLKATEHALRIAPADNAFARSEARMALDMDSHMTRAHGVIALTFVTEGNNFWVADQTGAFRAAYASASTAVADDHRDPWGHAMLGIAELWLNRAHERAVVNMRQALALNPSNAHIRALHSYVLSFTGNADTALSEIDTAMRMCPHFPPVFQGFRGRALLVLRRIDEALPCLEQMVALMPGHSNALGYLAVTYAALDRLDEAKATVDRLCETNPFYRLGALRGILPFYHAEDLNFVIENLARSGLPE